MPEFLETSNDDRIAFHHVEGKSPGVVFLGGFKSSMNGNKAVALDQWCRTQNNQFTRFDYFGHGASSGKFVDGTMGQWLEDTLRIIDDVCTGPQVVAGSSMGGWLALLAALARPERVTGLLGIACAADFTERLIWQGLSPEQQHALRKNGMLSRPSRYDESPYIYTWKLIEEARQHLLLDDKIAVEGPVRLVHGQHDVDVPWQISMQVAERLTSEDVTITLIKNGDHRLSTEAHLRVIVEQLAMLVNASDV